MTGSKGRREPGLQSELQDSQGYTEKPLLGGRGVREAETGRFLGFAECTWLVTVYQ